jgi:ABC-type uncharacterized transport system substrate-binding protein
MRARHRSGLALGVAVALAAVPAAAAAGGVCVAVSGGEHAAVAEAARRAVGVPADRVDVRDRRQLAALSSRCERLIIAVGTEALRVASENAPRSPIVHVMAANAQRTGLPGVSVEADPRRVLELLRKMAPGVRTIGAVYDPDLTGEMVVNAQAAARALGLELVLLPARSVGEAVRGFHRFEKELRVDALWLLPDGTATVQETVHYALELAHWRRMVVIGLSRWYVASGALFALAPRPESYGAAAGELGQQVLRGMAPSGVVHARDHALYVNLRTASRLGLKLPRQVVDAAEQVLP